MTVEDKTTQQADAQLEQALAQWHQHSRQQHALSPAQRRQLQSLVSQPLPRRDWRRTLQQCVALAACALVLLVWLQPETLIYQIEEQQQGLYTIQIHQLTPQTELTTVPTDTPAAVAPVVAGETPYQTRYQAYSQEYLRSQQQSAARTMAVWRERTAEGWQLRSCDHLQLQVQDDLLAALRRQQQDQRQWQLLEQSSFLQLTTGAAGQILALSPATEARIVRFKLLSGCVGLK